MKIVIRDILAVLPDGVKVCSVCVDNGVITAVGTVPQDFSADKTILGSGKMLIPGLINTHTHVYMSIFRNCADDLTFNDWLFNRILPLEDKLTQEDCYWGTMLGFMEMLMTGTTTFNDMPFFVDSAARAVAETGIRGVISRGLTGGTDDIAGGEKRLREAIMGIEKWKGEEKPSCSEAALTERPGRASSERASWMRSQRTRSITVMPVSRLKR